MKRLSTIFVALLFMCSPLLSMPAAAEPVLACFNDTHPAISPDGLSMLFVSDRAGNQDIYLSNMQARSIRQLTFSGSRESRPSWSGDGSQILFDSDRYQSDDIFVMTVDGSDQRRLTKNPAVDMFAKFSPDSTEIVFHSDRNEDREVFIMNSDGTDVRNLTKTPGRDGVASWSPGGNSILFHSTRTGYLHFQLYEMDVDGKNVQRIIHSLEPEEHASFSPDAHHIAYYREHPERLRNAEIYVLDRRTSRPSLAVPHDRYAKIGEYAPPAWFPDSRRFAFWATDHGAECSSIFITDVNGKNTVKFDPDWANFSMM